MNFEKPPVPGVKNVEDMSSVHFYRGYDVFQVRDRDGNPTGELKFKDELGNNLGGITVSPEETLTSTVNKVEAEIDRLLDQTPQA